MAHKNKVWGLFKGKKLVSEDTNLKDALMVINGKIVKNIPKRKRGVLVKKIGKNYLLLPTGFNIQVKTIYGKYDFWDNNPFKNTPRVSIKTIQNIRKYRIN